MPFLLALNASNDSPGSLPPVSPNAFCIAKVASVLPANTAGIPLPNDSPRPNSPPAPIKPLSPKNPVPPSFPYNILYSVL